MASGGAGASAAGADDRTRAEARRALERAIAYFRGQVASHGGYVYYYSLDLRRRWGEGEATADTIFVQPPGTPTVGMAYLDAFAATADPKHLDAAREAAEALVYGQLASGGWTQTIHFGPGRRVGKYRNGRGGDWNASSLDDGQTQAALRALVRTDQALKFRHAAIHEASAFGLAALRKAQFLNGGFPQVWTGPVERRPVLPARFPRGDWRTEGRIKNYWDHYTLNDNLAGRVAETLILAHEVYGEPADRAALEKLGDFLILAQMPDPQPGWCQQYNAEMTPIWARKFEPPAITGWESQDAMETLLAIARVTGQARYLDPIPKALAYFRARRLPDGRLARYYEFGTDRPLYMDRDYRLTYDDADAPAHYGWKQPSRLDAIERAHEAASRGPLRPLPKMTDRPSEAEVRRIIDELDAEGRWVSTHGEERLVGQPKFPKGFRYLSSERFAHHVTALSRYLKSADG